MIDLFEGMQVGTETQQKAYAAIKELNICNDLKIYNPVLCGNLPIGLDVVGSDLDMVMEVQDLDHFEKQLQVLYNDKNSFTLKRTTIRGNQVVKANFLFRNFEFELFGQSQPVHKQNAYIHMLIEHRILIKNPNLKKKVVNLKKQGYKTEPAFCTLLEIPGDPYDGLIQYGVEKGIVTEEV